MIVNDTFTDTDGTLLQNHTADDGGTWTRHVASDLGVDFQIASNRIFPEDGMSLYFHSAVPPSAEYDVEILFKILTGPEAGPGPTARTDPTFETYYSVIYNESLLSWRLFKSVLGTVTLLDSFDETLVDQDERTVRFAIRDSSKKVFIDGVERMSTADNEITSAGRIGVRSGGAGGTSTVGTHMDNLSASIARTGIRQSRSTRRRRRVRV